MANPFFGEGRLRDTNIKEYQLVKYGRFSYSDLENMCIADFEFFYKLLSADFEKMEEENNKLAQT